MAATGTTSGVRAEAANGTPRPGSPRQDNRRRALLDAAARIFNAKGYEGATIRDIAAATDMLPGSVYYHFASKDELFVAVHEEGVRRVVARVSAAIADRDDPWRRLEAACAAHLAAILDESDYAAVVIGSRPRPRTATGQRLARLRDDYEDLFRALVAALPLPADVDRKYFRLSLLGALNWSQTWYRADGADPARIAGEIVRLHRPAGAAR